MNRIKVPYKNLKSCIKHGYESTWYWTKHKNLKNPWQARMQAERKDRDRIQLSRKTPEQAKAIAQQRKNEA